MKQLPIVVHALKVAGCASLIVFTGPTAQAAGPRHSGEEVVETVSEALKPTRMELRQGFGYLCPLTQGRPGDKDLRSGCVLLENGRPLPTPHALHADIYTQGAGRYSHWTAGQIYFSTSDNSDPRTNGREYLLVSQQRVRRHSLTRVVRQIQTTYHVEAAARHPVQNRRLTLRHLDERATVIPRLSVRGWPDLTSVEGMLKSVLRPGMTDEQKCAAIWKLLVDWRYHYYPAENGDEMHDPVKLLNVYGYGLCDDSANTFAVLSRAAGLRARIQGLSGHVVGEAFYDGRWHMFDPDHQVYYRMPAGHVASVEELAAHPELITATPNDPVGVAAAEIAGLYTTTANNRAEESTYQTGMRLEPRLLPRDEVVFEFTGGGRAHRVAFRNEPPPPATSVGKLIRPLNLSRVKEKVNVRVEWPYVILGGELELQLAQSGEPVAVAILSDKGQWTPLTIQSSDTRQEISLDAWFNAQDKAHYACQLRLTSRAAKPIGEVVHSACLMTIFQCATRTLPRVDSGGTIFELNATSGSATALPADWAGIEITHEWDEVLDEIPLPAPGL
jgi:hypothetical protein